MWYLRYRRIMKCNGRKNFFRFFAYLALQRVACENTFSHLTRVYRRYRIS